MEKIREGMILEIEGEEFIVKRTTSAVVFMQSKTNCVKKTLLNDELKHMLNNSIAKVIKRRPIR